MNYPIDGTEKKLYYHLVGTEISYSLDLYFQLNSTQLNQIGVYETSPAQ